jgi:hypothetical protein
VSDDDGHCHRVVQSGSLKTGQNQHVAATLSDWEKKCPIREVVLVLSDTLSNKCR